MPYKEFKTESRRSWGKNLADTEGLSLEQIRIGCLQRIADATEVMAGNNAQMQEEINALRRGRAYWQQEAEAAQRQVAALKGVITKLKKKAANGTS